MLPIERNFTEHEHCVSEGRAGLDIGQKGYEDRRHQDNEVETSWGLKQTNTSRNQLRAGYWMGKSCSEHGGRYTITAGDHSGHSNDYRDIAVRDTN